MGSKTLSTPDILQAQIFSPYLSIWWVKNIKQVCTLHNPASQFFQREKKNYIWTKYPVVIRARPIFIHVSDLIGQKMQLTGWDNSNDMRNATYMAHKLRLSFGTAFLASIVARNYTCFSINVNIRLLKL